MSVEFKNRMGVNPSDYLGIIRMEKAKELLKTTSIKVKDVSAAVGYEDEHVFMRRFKKYVGKHRASIGRSIQNKIKSHVKKEKGYFI